MCHEKPLGIPNCNMRAKTMSRFRSNLEANETNERRDVASIRRPSDDGWKGVLHRAGTREAPEGRGRVVREEKQNNNRCGQPAAASCPDRPQALPSIC